MRQKKSRLVRQTKSFDKNFLILIISLLILGLIAVADVSAPQAINMFGDKFYFLKQQLIWAAIGVVAFVVTSLIHYSFWEKIALPFFLITVVLLLIVLLPSLGFRALGARRWIDLGILNLQPAELIKLSLTLYLAKVASKSKGILSYFIPLVLVTGLIMLQPDLGTTLVVAIIGLSQIFVSGISLGYFFLALGVGVASTIGLILLSPYRRERLLTFFEVSRDPLGKSYHIRQILLGLGSGGIFGVGLGASRQKFLFLPESSTDSIFAVIAEELGLIGGAAVIILFIYFIYKGLKIARNAPDKFSQMVAVGLTAWIGGQAFLNIASMVSLVPLTGIPLPFFSYGGSSLVMILVGCGILLSISKYQTNEK
jgi:cell division protein FtsW